MEINIETIEAKLKKVKLNTEGSQDNPTSRSDIEFECLAIGDLADTLVGCEVGKSLWDEEGNTRWLGVTAIKSQAELKNATMQFGDLTVEEVKVRKIEFQPINGRQIILKLQVQAHHTGQELLQFDKLQMVTRPLRIFTAQDDLFSNGSG